MKKAVVTGGAGFIGSHVVDALVGRGVEILIIDSLTSGSEKNVQGAKAKGKVSLIKSDICSKDAFDAICEFKPETIFHLAAQMDVRRSVKEPSFDAEKNIVGTVNLLEAARQAGTKQFVFSSTGGAIYGEQESFPADELHPNRPESPYGVSKKGAELYLEYFARFYGLQTISLRYSNVYGPRQNPHGEAGVVAIFTERVLEGKPLTVFGDGKQTRDFIYVGDVVDANMKVTSVGVEPGFFVYNVGRGREVTVLEIVDGIKHVWEKIGAKGGAIKPIEVSFAPARPGEQMRSVITPKKLEKTFGWSSTMELLEGLEVTFRSFLEGVDSV